MRIKVLHVLPNFRMKNMMKTCLPKRGKSHSSTLLTIKLLLMMMMTMMMRYFQLLYDTLRTYCWYLSICICFFYISFFLVYSCFRLAYLLNSLAFCFLCFNSFNILFECMATFRSCFVDL